MKQEAIISKQWEDIVFENRNQEYGAYTLRKTYSGNMVKAVVFTLIVIALFFAYPSIVEFFKSKDDSGTEEKAQQLTVNLEQPPPITPNQPPPPKVDIPPPVKEIIKFLPPKVTDKEVIEEEMPTQEELKQVDTGHENIKGTENVVFEEPVEEIVEDDSEKIFTVVEQQPEFEGGLAAMYKFISKNVKYPASARRMNIEGKVFVGFVVGKDGNISQIQIIKGLSTDLDKEAMRVVGTMPAWKPGKQGGRPVNVKFVLPITFKLN